MSEQTGLSKKRSKKIVENTSALLAPKRIKVLITIVNREKASFYLDVLEGFEVNLQHVIYGKGTAPSDVLHYLGLSESNKAILLSIVQEDRIKEILNLFEDKYFKTKNGKGIAFTIPITSVIGVAVYQFLCNLDEGRKG